MIGKLFRPIMFSYFLFISMSVNSALTKPKDMTRLKFNAGVLNFSGQLVEKTCEVYIDGILATDGQLQNGNKPAFFNAFAFYLGGYTPAQISNWKSGESELKVASLYITNCPVGSMSWKFVGNATAWDPTVSKTTGQNGRADKIGVLLKVFDPSLNSSDAVPILNVVDKYDFQTVKTTDSANSHIIKIEYNYKLHVVGDNSLVANSEFSVINFEMNYLFSE